ncbi:hypothetical protein [Kribbella sp. NPDC006257]|uniref:hypothetical protein n=1 Tax=Kribbella sp. NPDC006257 TaxID=3156738 RepID=UPI0033BFB54F
MVIIEDIGQYDWWPYSVVEPDQKLAGVWLPAEDGAEGLIIAEMARCLNQWSWLVSGTWYGKDAASIQGFDRYPGLMKDLIGSAQSRTPRELATVSEWGVGNPDPAQLSSFAASVRSSRGRSYCLALAPEDFSRRTWYGVTMGAYWRAVLAFHFEPAGLQYTDRAIAGCYLEQLAKSRFVAVIPLDMHPQFGFALIGSAEQAGLVAAALADSIPSMRLEEVAKLHERGGGLAF